MQKIVVANRSEIALRIMRTCRDMGIKTVAVFSEADRGMPFVQYADEAVCIGAAPSNESYLQQDKIIDVCKKTGAQGVHPGYGFLSENATFARKVREAGLIFIGPSPESMEMMGSKIAAKETARKHNIPLVPGVDYALKDIHEAKKIAKEVGYPILIKASAGGGGKGMRIVNDEANLEESMKLAMSEALSAFGDNSVFIEKYVTAPRHIEVQVMADNHGNCVYLFERECSIQRRHQKLVEEAPSTVLTPELRARMGACAVACAKACNYSGAGTVEFLVDDTRNFYFLEMNTRLQVEHPVTELICGLDLVKEQIRVARNEKLGYTQEDIVMRGHAIELRVCAEDPANNFLPDIGTLEVYRRPAGVGVRVDDGYEEGMAIPIYYDNMIAKLITYGASREEARERMLRAIDAYDITGLATTLQFGKWVMQHPAFIKGEFDTNFIGKYFSPHVLEPAQPDGNIIAAILAYEFISHKPQATSTVNNTETTTAETKWKKRKEYR